MLWKRKAKKGAEKSELTPMEVGSLSYLEVDALLEVVRLRDPGNLRFIRLLEETRLGLIRRMDREKVGSQRGHSEADVTQANEAGMRPMDANDLARLRMFAGASFAPGFSLRLPSGLTLTGNEINTARKWAEEE